MKYVYILVSFLLFFFIFGCEKEHAYENIYNGLQQAEQIKNPTDEPVPKKQPSYGEYKKERDKALQIK